MHTHPTKDHTFYILQGEGTFHLEKNENVVVAGKHEVLFLPAGSEWGSGRIIEGRPMPGNRIREDAMHAQPRKLPF